VRRAVIRVKEYENNGSPPNISIQFSPFQDSFEDALFPMFFRLNRTAVRISTNPIPLRVGDRIGFSPNDKLFMVGMRVEEDGGASGEGTGTTVEVDLVNNN
jgi:hypothetical protein